MNLILPPEENRPPEKPASSSWLATLAFLVVAAGVTAITFVLVSPLLVIVPIFGVAIWVQYLVWGRWMEGYYAEYRRKLDEEENRND